MKTILLSLSIICFTSALAQESVGEVLTQQSKWTFGWVYSPEVSHRILGEGTEANQSTFGIIDSRNDSERAKFGQSFSLFLGYRVSKTFTLEGGFGYTDFGEGLKPVDLTSVWAPEEIFGTYYGVNHLHVASLPITLHVNLGGRRVKWFVSAGVAPSLLMSANSTSRIEYSNGDVQTSSYFSNSAQEEYSRFILGANVSAGIDYQYSEKASLRIAPVFRITATDTYSDVPIRANYFNAGIEFGTVYKL